MSFLFLAVPTELAGGRYPAPAWLILALGGLVIVGAAGYLVARARRASGKAPPPTPKDKP